MKVSDRSSQPQSKVISPVRSKTQQPPVEQIIQNWRLQNKGRDTGQVIQGVLSINGEGREEEYTETDIDNESTRKILNSWIEQEKTYGFANEEAAIARAQALADQYQEVTDRAKAVIEQIEVVEDSEEYIDAHWREIEVIVRDLQNIYDHPEFKGLQGDIDDVKWDLIDHCEGCEGGIFEAKRAQIIRDYLDQEAPHAPDVAEDNPARQVADTELTKIGHLSWVGAGGGPNTFRQWVEDEHTVLDNSSSMNCWEAIFYSAWQAGLMSRGKILELYEDVNEDGNYFVNAIDIALSPRQSLFDIIEHGGLQRGDIIIIGGSVEQHVAMSLGGKQVLSLWNQPDENLTLQQTSLQEITGEDESDLNQVQVVRNSTLFVPQ